MIKKGRLMPSFFLPVKMFASAANSKVFFTIPHPAANRLARFDTFCCDLYIDYLI